MDPKSPSDLSGLMRRIGITTTVTIVDVGANPSDGEAPYTPLIRSGQAKVIGFETNREILAKLNRSKGPAETYLPQAIGDGQTHTLHYCHAPGMTSLLQPNHSLLSQFHLFSEWGQVLSSETVETARLDDLPEVEGMDYLKIDIQGAELMVLENAKDRLSNAVLVQTEVEMVPMYVDQPLFSDVDIFMRRQGFLLHRFEPMSSRVFKPLIINGDLKAAGSQMLWTDAIYIKDFTRLDRLTPTQILTLAVILHECYRSLDLVLYLLIAHDRIAGSAYAQPYLAAILGKQRLG